MRDSNSTGGQSTSTQWALASRLLYHNLGGYLRSREVTAVLAARATPAMGLVVREVGPIETPRHQHTLYLPATTVPPTVVALRPKKGGNRRPVPISPIGN